LRLETGQAAEGWKIGTAWEGLERGGKVWKGEEWRSEGRGGEGKEKGVRVG